MYLTPLLMLQAKGSFLNLSMSMIGVRVESSTIQVAKKYNEFLEVNNNKPDKLTSDGDGIYKDAVIVFRGIGENVVVKINDFSMSIPAKDVIIGNSASKQIK